jgi:hypothetical protein
MHECPECQRACDCDGEDTWNDAAADECTHRCAPEDRDDDQDDYACGECPHGIPRDVFCSACDDEALEDDDDA